ncbi:5-formyltetrahydrofolate cyclo-ligase [Pseudonocardia spinosispora]|uniref:5-formyltetrahydrofolate cyclo-ligase n=1 Tax=Pseudonocardia spinosispora TaxID=103441 RepID=UPI0003F6F024|nr:5-formyltetrahydrofolate cyclo-ligase [Pseudonocardia spinosispora]
MTRAGAPPPDDSTTAAPDGGATDKTAWRGRLLAARRAVPAAVHAEEADALAEAAVAAAQGRDGPVCCYVPMPGEPGSMSMLDALRSAGHEVLLPVVPNREPAPAGAPRLTRAPSGPMDWAPYSGPSCLVEGPHRLRQPGGPGWGPAAIAVAGLVLVPALAVDRRGVRLGRGAGWYDRTLPLAKPTTALVAVVRDEEWVDRLPAERHDVLMHGVLTPTGGLRALADRLD